MRAAAHSSAAAGIPGWTGSWSVAAHIASAFGHFAAYRVKIGWW